MKLKIGSFLIITVLIFSALLSGCSRIYSINVNYQRPPAVNILSGRSFVIEVDNKMDQGPILGKTAAEMLPHFMNTFVLTLKRDGKQYSREGGLDLALLFYKTMAERIHAMGGTVKEFAQSGTERMAIEINRFIIDKQGRKWTASTSYNAMLKKSGNIVRQESVRAEVERITLLGPDSVNQVASDLVETAINKLDLQRLLTTR